MTDLDIDDFLDHASVLVELPIAASLSDGAAMAYMSGDGGPLWDEVATATSQAIDWAIAVAGNDLLGEGAHEWLKAHGTEVMIELMSEHAGRLRDEFLSNALLPICYRSSREVAPSDDISVEDLLESLLLMDLHPDGETSEIEAMIEAHHGERAIVEGEALITGLELANADPGDGVSLDRVHVTFLPEEGEAVTTAQSYPMHSFVPLHEFVLLAELPDAYQEEASLLATSMVREAA